MDVIITTIFPPTPAARALADGLTDTPGALWVIGDAKGPANYNLPNTRFFDLEAQLKLPFELPRSLPLGHYARKNIGYLLAIASGTKVLVETDDDNIPQAAFWELRANSLNARTASTPGWINAYAHFLPVSDDTNEPPIWPRGLPLDSVANAAQPLSNETAPADCQIIQGLADENPDVDAVYRLTRKLPFYFANETPALALNRSCWCPFNSQNTTHFPAAYPLLYLPSHCSFRMTDIWRSFVSQRCLWEMDSRVGFTAPSVRQERNEHNLMRDFEQEVPGFMQNDRIRDILESLELKTGRATESVLENLHTCYESLVRADILPAAELDLLRQWGNDLQSALGAAAETKTASPTNP
jgi:hypothetical protein